MDVMEKLVDIVCDATQINGCIHSCYHPPCAMVRGIVDAMIENGVTVQDWVPIKDGLPERPPDRVDEQGRSWFTTNIDCIVYDGKSVFAANYCFQNKCFWCADTLHPLKNITHWMPMPDPPKGE